MLSSSAAKDLACFFSLSLLHKHLTGVLSSLITVHYHYIVAVFITLCQRIANCHIYVKDVTDNYSCHAAQIQSKP